MLKKLIYSVVFIFISVSVFSQEITTSIYHHYEGTIDDKYPISMDIIVHGKEIKGSYFYKKIGKIISVLGTIDANNLVIMNEYSSFVPYSGYFEGKISGNNFSGIWTDVTGSKKLKFLLIENYNHSAQIELYHYSNETQLLAEYPEMKYFQTGTFLFTVSCPIRAAQSLILEDLQKFYFQNPCTDIKNCINDYLKESTADYLSMKVDLDTTDILSSSYIYNWEVNDTVLVLYNENDFLTLEFNEYSYTGGAHGNYGTSYINYDTHSGKRFELWDVIDSKNKDIFLSLIKQKIIDQELEDYVFSMDEVTIAEDFALLKNDLILMYNPYEIGPYSTGQIIIDFKYSDLIKYLTPEFKQKLGL